jgi:hypothetical protein
MAVESVKSVPIATPKKDAEELVIRFEKEKRAWKAESVAGKRAGYDVVSRGPKGRIRYIAVRTENQLRDMVYSIDVLRLGKRLSNFYLYVVNLPTEANGKKSLFVVPPNVVFPNTEPYVQFLFRVKSARRKGIERHSLA